MKRTILLCISLVLLFSSNCATYAKSSDEFIGSRTIDCLIDSSDLRNYLDGGLKSIDSIVMNSKYEWLNYSSKQETREIKLLFSFSFESFEDYTQKLAILLTYTPAIVHSGDTYIEGFSAIELLGFIESDLHSNGMIEEMKFEELIRVTSSILKVNDAEYSSTASISNAEKNLAVNASRVRITTTMTEEGFFNREINIEYSENTQIEKAEKAFLKYFKDLDLKSDQISRDKNHISVRYISKDLDELKMNTTVALRASNSIKEYQNMNGLNVTISYSELFDLSSILAVDGEFYYSFETPETFKNIRINYVKSDKNATVSGNTVTYTGTKTRIFFDYDTKFQFEEVIISTDLSNVFGIIKKNIVFAVPEKLYLLNDGLLSYNLTHVMNSKVKFTRYTEGGYVYYSVSYSSKKIEKLNEFVRGVLVSSQDFSLEKHSSLWIEGNVEEVINIDKVVELSNPPNKIVAEYIMPIWSETDGEGARDNNIYRINLVAGGTAEFEYKYPNILLITGVFTAIIIILIGTLIVIRKIKKKKTIKKLR